MYPNQLVAERTNAIPCQYKGINFRSLLEARWAYFFDKLGWTWQYEPFEMDGYIPDFMITDRLSFFVDIKPYHDSNYKESVYNKVEKWNDKFVTDYKVLRYSVLFFDTVSFLNLHLFARPDSELYQACSLGSSHILIPEYISGKKAVIVKNKSYNWYCGELINADGYNSDTVYKLPDDRLILKKDYDLFIEKLRKYWAEAQNATQYKPKTPQQFIEIKQANEFETSLKNVSLKNVASYKQAKQLAEYNLLFDVFNVFDVLDEKKITTLWEQVLDKLEPPTTRTLLRQHGSFFNIKGQNIYLKLPTEQLLKMARLRLPNIEKAFYDVLGYSVQVHLQTDAITAPKDVDNTSIVSVEATPVKEENNKNQENNYYDQVKKLLQDYNLKQKYTRAICCRVGIVVEKVVKKEKTVTPMSVLREQLFNLFENDPQKVITVVLQNFRELLEDNTNIAPVKTASVKEENNKNQENNCYDQVKELVQPTNKHNLTYNCLDNLVKYPLDYTEKTLYNLPRRQLRRIASALKINQRRNRVEISKSVMLNEIFDIYRKTPETVINAVHKTFPDLLLGETK